MGPAFILLTTITWLLAPSPAPITAPVPVPTGATTRILATEAGATQPGLPPKPATTTWRPRATSRGVVRGHAGNAEDAIGIDPDVRLATGPECVERRCGRPR